MPYELRSGSVRPPPEPVHPSSRATDTRLSYENAKKWTLDHLRITNLQQETDVSIDRIIDAKYIPFDSVPGKYSVMRNERFRSFLACQRPDYQRIAELLQNPTLEDADSLQISHDIGDPNRPSFMFFNDLRESKLRGRLASYDSQRIYVLMGFLRQVYPDRYLFVSQSLNVCFGSASGVTPLFPRTLK